LGDDRTDPEHAPETTHRDVQEGADHHRVKLATRGPHQFGSGGGDRYRAAVGARCSDGLVYVRHRDDPGPEADLVPGEPVGIAVAIEPLMVLGDRQAPLLEPVQHRSDQRGAGLGVGAKNLPLRLGGVGWLVEDLGRHPKLADVVQQRRPAEPTAVSL
jgi:hypothetical protein